MTTFGTWLGELISERGLSRVTVAEAVGVTKAHLTNIIQGRRSTNPELAVRLADYLELTPTSPERDRFLMLAAVTHLPSETHAQIESALYLSQEVPSLRDQVVRLKDEVTDLRDRYQAVLEKLAEDR